MYIVPYFDKTTEKIIDGEVSTLHKFCSKDLSEKCQEFYRNIDKAGFYICPFGYTTYATNSSISNNILYTSLLVEGHYDKKKIKKREEEKNKFSEDEITRLIGIFEQLYKRAKTSETNAEYEATLIRGIFHEVRRLSRDINSQSMGLLKKIGNNDEKISPIIDNILATLQLMSIRVDSYELYKNPRSITSASQPNISIYRKFDKARFILNAQSKTKKVNLNFHNQSNFSINGYEIFDLLPYVLLDNAIKYSIKNQEVDVYFDDKERSVVVKNFGPQISQEQLPLIFTRGYRGENTTSFDGSGLGLFLAKQIAELHNIKLQAKSQDKAEFHVEGIPYSEFTMTLSFK